MYCNVLHLSCFFDLICNYIIVTQLLHNIIDWFLPVFVQWYSIQPTACIEDEHHIFFVSLLSLPKVTILLYLSPQVQQYITEQFMTPYFSIVLLQNQAMLFQARGQVADMES